LILPGARCFAFGSFRPVAPFAFKQRTTPEITGTVSRISADVSQDQRSGQSYQAGHDQILRAFRER